MYDNETLSSRIQRRIQSTSSLCPAAYRLCPAPCRLAQQPTGYVQQPTGYVQQPTSYGHHTNNTVVVLKDEILIKQNRVSQSHRKKHTR